MAAGPLFAWAIPAFVAWRPFLDPISAHDWWFLFLAPLSFLIAMAYKAVRVVDLSTYWREVWIMTLQMIGAIVLLAGTSYIFLQVVVPVIAPMPG